MRTWSLGALIVVLAAALLAPAVIPEAAARPGDGHTMRLLGYRVIVEPQIVERRHGPRVRFENRSLVRQLQAEVARPGRRPLSVDSIRPPGLSARSPRSGETALPMAATDRPVPSTGSASSMEWRAIVVASCVVFAAGCKEVAPSEPVDPPEPAGQPEPVGQPEPAEAEPEAEPPDEPEAPAGEEDEAPQVADLDVVDHEALVERIARGDQEVTVVAAWATWCVPCIEEMPTLAEFWKERRGDGIHVIGLSMDDPDEMGERIQSVLDRQRPPYEILVLEPGTEDAFMGAVDASWGGSLPATIVYDGDGEQVDFWMDKVTAEALDERVGERLAR